MKLHPTDFLPLINKLIKPFPKPLHKELTQECYLKICEISDKYSPEMGTPQTFLFIPIRNAIYRYLATERKHQYLSLDEVIEDEEGHEMTWADNLKDDFDLESYLGEKDEVFRIWNRIPREHKKVLIYIYQGYRAKEIAEKTGYNKSYISKIKKKYAGII